MGLDKDLSSIQEARDLANAAHEAWKDWSRATQADVDRVCAAMAEAGYRASERLGRLAQEETGYGVAAHKKLKNEFGSRWVWESIRDLKTVGVIRHDPARRLYEIASPMGLVTALEKFVTPPVFDRATLTPLLRQLAACVATIPGCELVSPKSASLANTLSFTVRGSDGIALMAGLDMEGICASSGSACSAGSLEPSHVILATGRSAAANSLVRFSLGRGSTPEEVDYVCSALPEVVRRAQRG